MPTAFSSIFRMITSVAGRKASCVEKILLSFRAHECCP